jgi:hypothetical protein
LKRIIPNRQEEPCTVPRELLTRSTKPKSGEKPRRLLLRWAIHSVPALLTSYTPKMPRKVLPKPTEFELPRHSTVWSFLERRELSLHSYVLYFHYPAQTLHYTNQAGVTWTCLPFPNSTNSLPSPYTVVPAYLRHRTAPHSRQLVADLLSRGNITGAVAVAHRTWRKTLTPKETLLGLP